ncbi:hypothetical protein EDD71_11464 [Fonticella tunisiensis]|uniref:Uncharacterized protein n=1 Tax=Fonticella tunisiensis TaxID=1096341 RepID=A0A4R7KB12_9CLOT|nr:hypothetical protein EDD71_11464 [Fonticella tunisiensis]
MMERCVKKNYLKYDLVLKVIFKYSKYYIVK